MTRRWERHFVRKRHATIALLSFTITRHNHKSHITIQGPFRWLEYLQKWLRPAKGEPGSGGGTSKKTLFRLCVERSIHAHSWEEALGAMKKPLAGVGPYTCQQSMLTVLYGVFQGDIEATFEHGLKVECTMNDFAYPGPGPLTSMSKMFGTEVIK